MTFFKEITKGYKDNENKCNRKDKMTFTFPIKCTKALEKRFLFITKTLHLLNQFSKNTARKIKEKLFYKLLLKSILKTQSNFDY